MMCNFISVTAGCLMLTCLTACGSSSPAVDSNKSRPEFKTVSSTTSSSSTNSEKAISDNSKDQAVVSKDMYYPVGPIAERMLLRKDNGPLAWPAQSEWGLRETAADALSRIGAPAVPELANSLRDPDPQVRLQAARALSRIGLEAAPAVPALTAALNDSDAAVRMNAARALGQIGPAAKGAVPELIRALHPDAKR